jgi:hypothetical protein
MRGRNSDGGESNSRVVGVTSLQITMYNCDRYAGANQTLNSIVYYIVNNRFAFIRNKYTHELFFQLYDMHNRSKLEKDEFKKNIQDLVLMMR